MRRRGVALRRRLAEQLRDSADVLGEYAAALDSPAGYRYVATMRAQADALDADAPVEVSGWQVGRDWSRYPSVRVEPGGAVVPVLSRREQLETP